MTGPTPRPEAVAGAFYPADPEELRAALADAFQGPRGPGGLPPRAAGTAPRIRALVVPHAGYVYSGAIAARAYARVAAEPPPPEVLVLGVDHHGLGEPFALSRRPWRTPLGTVPVAEGLVEALRGGPIVVDEATHRLEHSIEVQLPFLQLVAPGVPVAMLTVGFDDLPTLLAVGERVRSAVSGRPTLLIASTDFSHYVPAEVARKLDARAVGAIVRGDPRELYEVVERDRISMCGIAPTTVLLAALRGESLRTLDLGWGHSGEVEPMRTVVGYDALVLERAAAA